MHFVQLKTDLNRLRFTLTSRDMAPPEICGWLSISVAAYLATLSAFGYSKNAIALPSLFYCEQQNTRTRGLTNLATTSSMMDCSNTWIGVQKK